MENDNYNKKGFWQTIKDNPKILETVSIYLGPCSHPDPISSYSPGVGAIYLHNIKRALNSVDCSVRVVASHGSAVAPK